MRVHLELASVRLEVPEARCLRDHVRADSLRYPSGEVEIEGEIEPDPALRAHIDVGGVEGEVARAEISVRDLEGPGQRLERRLVLAHAASARGVQTLRQRLQGRERGELPVAER